MTVPKQTFVNSGSDGSKWMLNLKIQSDKLLKAEKILRET